METINEYISEEFQIQAKTLHGGDYGKILHTNIYGLGSHLTFFTFLSIPMRKIQTLKKKNVKGLL